VLSNDMTAISVNCMNLDTTITSRSHHSLVGAPFILPVFDIETLSCESGPFSAFNLVLPSRNVFVHHRVDRFMNLYQPHI